MSNSFIIAFIIFILTILGFLLVLGAQKGASPSLDILNNAPTPDLNQHSAAASPATNNNNTTAPAPTFAPVTELKIENLKPGMGKEVASGSSVTVNYIGRLTNGQVFDTSLSSGRQPLSFQVGAGQVIKGWEEGLIGMKVGGQRRLIIPPDKGYGPNGYPPAIPPNATLIFDIELLDVK